jgi:putative oxidoreductase
MKRLISTSAPAAVILIRLMVGAVFVSEGIQKLLFAAEVGAGRFAKIGIPSPEIVAPFVGCFEIVCGSLVLLGLLTRLAVIPLIVIMLTAIATTKVPILMNEGFWKMAHEARTDWSMLLGLTFLLILGAGPWSVDALLSKNRASELEPTL